LRGGPQQSPQAKMYGSINVDPSYFNNKTFVPGPTLSLEPNGIMGSFFASSLRKAKQYSVEEWEEILHDERHNQLDKERIYSSLYRGLPPILRRRIWLYLAEAKSIRQENLNEGVCYEELKQALCNKEDKIKKRPYS